MAQKTAKLTVDVGDPRLYKAIKILAIERGLTLRAVVVEALNDWVGKQEDLEDLAAIEEVRKEPTRPIEELSRELGDSDLLSSNQ